MQSLNNQSNIPLRANAIYIGTWDDIIKYQNIQINLNADTNCEITYYTSNDKVLIDSTVFQYNANSNYFNSINSISRYVYFTVRNLQNIDQNNFNFSVLYKDYPVSGGGIASNVTIDNPLNQDGSVFVGGNLALTGDVNANITNQSLDVNVLNSSIAVSGSVSVSNLNDLSGVRVDISGETVNVSNLSDISGVYVNNTQLNKLTFDQNNYLYADISGQTVNIGNSSIPISGSVSVSNLNDLSGVRVDISGETVNVSNLSDISGVYVNNTQLNKLTFDQNNYLYADISGQTVNIGNSSIPISGSVSVSNLNDLSGVRVDISGETINVSNLSDISGIYVNNTQLNKLTFDSGNNLDINLNNVSSGFLQSGGLKSYLVNTSLAVTNSALSNMSFSSGNLNVKDTQNSYTSGALNVSDATTHTTLTNIYNCVNTRGSGIFIQGPIVMGGYTSVINLSTLPVKCLTIYGVSSDATILTVLFSQDGSSFHASQYSYTLATANNFGFALNACPKYICLQSSQAVTTLQAYLDYS